MYHHQLNLVLIKEIEGILVSYILESTLSFDVVYDTNDLYNRQQTYLDQQFEGNHGSVIFLFHKAIIL